jgi:hypothetical protein
MTAGNGRVRREVFRIADGGTVVSCCPFMTKHGESTDPGAAQFEASPPANFEVKADRSIVGAVSAGDRSKAEGTVTVHAIHAENVYLVGSAVGEPPSATPPAKRRRLKIGILVSLLGIGIGGAVISSGNWSRNHSPTDSTAGISPIAPVAPPSEEPAQLNPSSQPMLAPSAPIESIPHPVDYRGVLRGLKDGQPISGERIILIGTPCVAVTSKFGTFDFEDCPPSIVSRLVNPSIAVEAKWAPDRWQCSNIPLKKPPLMTEIRLELVKCRHVEAPSHAPAPSRPRPRPRPVHSY